MVGGACWAFVIGLLGVVGGCLSFGDITGGETSDAALDAEGNDVQSIDSGLPSDAALMTDSPIGAAFCVSQVDAAFCDSFDQVDAATFSGWQPPHVDNGASLTLTTSGLSPPEALLAEVRANLTGSLQVGANISRLVGDAVSVRYEYDLLVDTYDTSGSVAFIGAMDERVGLADVELRLYLNAVGVGLGAAIADPDGATSFPTFASELSLSVGNWHHVTVDVDYGRTPAKVSFSFDTVSVFADADVPGATFGPGAITAQAGFLYARTPTAGWKIRVDNVVVYTN